MTKKEKMELLLAKVPDEQKAAFIEELREAKTKDAMQALMKKYNIRLTDEEKETIKPRTNELSDEELDLAAGGCCGSTCTNDCNVGCGVESCTV